MTTIESIRMRIESSPWLNYGLIYDEENQTFTDGEIEYQLRGYGYQETSELRSILVRFCQDETHSYREFFFYTYEDSLCPEEAILEDVFSETTLDIIGEAIHEKLKLRRRIYD